MSDTDKRTATMRLEDLEKVVTMLFQGTTQLKNATEGLLKSHGELPLIKEALRILNKKTEAIILNAAPETGITTASVSASVIKMNVEDLTAQVSAWKESGHLTVAEEVADDSFLVCEESHPDGTLANPRTQFRLDSIEAATATALKGKKVGDQVSFGEGKFGAKILEIYSVTEPKSAEASSETKPDETPAAGVASTEAPTETPVEATPVLASLPEETPVVQFVPSDASTMVTAS